MGAYTRTCKWCGKHYELNQVHGGWDTYSYCSLRCQSAAKRERQRENQQAREEAEKFEKDHPLLSSIFKLFVVGFFAVLLIIGLVKQRGNNEQKTKEAAQENVVTKSSSEEKNFVQSVKQQEIETDRETEDLIMDHDRVIDGIEEDFAEESDIEEIDEEIFEDHGIAIVEEEDFSNQKIYDIVDEMPVFTGGDHELIRYISDNLDYPKDAMESGIEGRVFVKIIVEPNGSISNAKIIRGLGYGCDEEAIRVVESMPNWVPGRKNGEAVRVNMAVPVNFKLQ